VPQPEDSGSELRCEAINEAVTHPVFNIITIDVATTTTTTTTTSTTTTTTTTATTFEYEEETLESSQDNVIEEFQQTENEDNVDEEDSKTEEEKEETNSLAGENDAKRGLNQVDNNILPLFEIELTI
jgi:23S rRNA U2552 (ribose-2'-O)-methylase RlmE/FtsJ